jgi:Pentapeptide repeats (9 copies)
MRTPSKFDSSHCFNWRTCTQDGCIGSAWAEGFCLRHLRDFDQAGFSEALACIGNGQPVDLRGVRVVDNGLLEAITDALPTDSGGGRPKAGDTASFQWAEFEGGANFERVLFGDDVSFAYAEFGDDASFYDAIFGNHTVFADAIFGGSATFVEATFESHALFDRTQFGPKANFRQVTAR